MVEFRREIFDISMAQDVGRLGCSSIWEFEASLGARRASRSRVY